MFSKGLLPIPEDSDRVSGVGTGHWAPSTGHPGGRERREMRVKWMVGVHLYSVYSAHYSVQHPVAGHKPSVTERASERMGRGQRTSERCQRLVIDSGTV